MVGAATTFLGIMPLAFASNVIFRVFFKMFLVIICFGVRKIRASSMSYGFVTTAAAAAAAAIAVGAVGRPVSVYRFPIVDATPQPLACCENFASANLKEVWMFTFWKNGSPTGGSAIDAPVNICRYLV